MTSSSSRIALALSATLVLGGCQDGSDPLAPNAPTPSISAPSAVASESAAPAAGSAMVALGADLVTDTEIFLAVVEDAQARTAASAAIKTLADALTAGDAAAAKTALTTARERVAAIPGELALYELAPVGLALDKVEQVLQGA